jgi:hypothetical protein
MPFLMKTQTPLIRFDRPPDPDPLTGAESGRPKKRQWQAPSLYRFKVEEDTGFQLIGTKIDGNRFDS